MKSLIDLLVSTLKSGYLVFFWALIVGYAGVYGLARVLVERSRSDETLLYRCRGAWGYSIAVHALVSAVSAYIWYNQNGFFSSFWRFFPFYLALIILDLAFAGALLGTRGHLRRYINY